MNCQRPDPYAPGIVCGQPLPCPYHTVTVDTTGEVPTVTIPVSAVPLIGERMLEVLKGVSRAIHEERQPTADSRQPNTRGE
ncbi:hypothetical protein LCGC14_1546500 [marine sediment metagenome]|uniref:Uncharacterized protein n=1 Tax=marine sediment metagenome TaxID=412755 RepID=A0A0F9JCF0_9ZZZZ